MTQYMTWSSLVQAMFMRCQAIAWTNDCLKANYTLQNKIQRVKIFLQERAFEKIVCKMTIISFQPQCVNKTLLVFLKRSKASAASVGVILYPNTEASAMVYPVTGLILGLRPANERRRYKVTPSLIGWAQT